LFLQFYPSFKDRFDSECNNLGTGYIENCRNLRTSLIAFIGGSKYKEVWHERTKQTPVRGPAPPDPIPSDHIQVMGHLVLLNCNSWNLSQPQDFQRSDASYLIKLCFWKM